MASFQGTYAPQSVHHHAPTTAASASVAFNANGACPHHPDVLLRQKRMLGWKVLLPECPRCKTDWEDDRRRRLSTPPPQAPAARSGGVCKAKYAQTCKLCHGSIKVGQFVRSTESTGWVHANC